MAFRLMELTVPSHLKESVNRLFDEIDIRVSWFKDDSNESLLAKVTLKAAKTGEVIDALEKKCGDVPGFQLALLPIEAVLPRPIEATAQVAASQPKKIGHSSVSREELYNDIVGSSEINRVYIAMVILSTIVAVFGIHYENIAAIIGAMVIAPLLGPNVALSFATTLGDFDLVKKSIKVNLLGLLIALILSITFGLLLSVDANNSEILVRTQVRLGDIVLALASGAAGVLAFTSGVPTTLIGVMVAVALLPPLVTLGLMIASGNISMAVGAMTLLVVNVICINLAGVTTFLFQGIMPQRWWEKEKASKASTAAMILWAMLLSVLILVIKYR